MKFITAIFFIYSVLTAGSAYAGQAEVRDIALLNNCPPKKIEIYSQALGPMGKTVYRVQCTLPKTVAKTEGGAKPPDAILIGCDQNLCNMMRPVSLEKK